MSEERPRSPYYGNVDMDPLAVLTVLIRLDVTAQVHNSIAKNKRQVCSVSKKAGHQTSAEKQTRFAMAMFNNMCHGGCMFAPTRAWRKWRVKVDQSLHRFAVVSALAIEEVMANAAETFTKTKEAVALKSFTAYTDLVKVSNLRKLDAGKEKMMRNHRHCQCRGPLIVFRKLPDVELVNFWRLDLLQLMPGSHLDPFVFGTFDKVSTHKKDYTCPATPKISNPNVTCLTNSDEIQSISAPRAKSSRSAWTQKKNPLGNKAVLFHLNQYAKTIRRHDILVQERLKKNAKKPKQPNVAGEAFTVTLLAPKQNFPRPLEACECRWGREEREFMRRKFRVYI
ncbi:ribosomal protein L4 domain-containing protein [Mycena olivaceomarginata]|nr:ribosomal protein L4 domain-containing protein [Mycena olivaceomarginata]